MAIGALAGLLIFVLLICIRNSFRNEVIRACRSEEYMIGWKDAIRHTKTQIDRWVKSEPEKRE